MVIQHIKIKPRKLEICDGRKKKKPHFPSQQVIGFNLNQEIQNLILGVHKIAANKHFQSQPLPISNTQCDQRRIPQLFHQNKLYIYILLLCIVLYCIILFNLLVVTDIIADNVVQILSFLFWFIFDNRYLFTVVVVTFRNRWRIFTTSDMILKLWYCTNNVSK